ncbi:hypothetical protein BOTBODRAFT_41685 [Botryobasidium botryosum FD-172 SS1]|uniref:Uncharacterized protein n=1 Tax=Botryobasidium botryosum (strain FD-172 SS1) TaxID=930990 RepID=A0A067MUR1_BOTB1|nr:hypothetical protein BOTBODRAFT_41685 [Botryobasidium botryosum FD-172 SS1]
MSDIEPSNTCMSSEIFDDESDAGLDAEDVHTPIFRALSEPPPSRGRKRKERDDDGTSPSPPRAKMRRARSAESPGTGPLFSRDMVQLRFRSPRKGITVGNTSLVASVADPESQHLDLISTVGLEGTGDGDPAAPRQPHENSVNILNSFVTQLDTDAQGIGMQDTTHRVHKREFDAPLGATVSPTGSDSLVSKHADWEVSQSQPNELSPTAAGSDTKSDHTPPVEDSEEARAEASTVAPDFVAL